MNANWIRVVWILSSVVAITACVDPFNPPVTKDDADFLVVDGFVNTNSHTVTVKLSHSMPLSTITSPIAEENATVELEESAGNSYVLSHEGNGIYRFTSPDLITGKQYRLSVKSQGDEYLSEYVVAKATPPIDSVSWTPEDYGLFIKVNTHDPANGTHYYRWDFSEAWEYTAPYSSDWILDGQVARYRTTNEQIYTCYIQGESTDIYAATTNDLSEDRVSNFELNFIPKGSQRVSRMYSILVRQYALSKEGFNYWQQLKKSTEDLGTLFDPQPARVKGNMKNVNDAADAVIGFFDAGEIAEQRIFIRMTDLPSHLQKFGFPADCTQSSIAADSVANLPANYLLTSAIYQGLAIVGYNFTTLACADCRTQGGKTTKPDFWP